MIFKLNDNDYTFPDPALAEPDGLLAFAGDLGRERLIAAYHAGIFPWFSEDEPICWYAPHERCVIFPSQIKVSKSLQKIIDKNVFSVTFNAHFEDVIFGCKTTSRVDQDGTWITNKMHNAYVDLHKIGIAKSVEVWQNNELVGGLYGLEINGIFCGESMFSKVSNASKVALVWICLNKNYLLIDCQLRTEHLISMGAKMISREDYMNILNDKSA